MSHWDDRKRIVYVKKEELIATTQSKRAKKQRKLIAKNIVCPPPENRVFGPPTREGIDWDNAAVQQRYLQIVNPVSEHEEAYNKWRVGHPAEPIWKSLNFIERAQWAQFYFNFETLTLKDGFDVGGKKTDAKAREECCNYYKKMFKRNFVPEKLQENKKRQKVYDVNGNFIGWLNRELEPYEKEKSSRDKVLNGRIKKQSGKKAKQYGPEDAVPKRGPWRPVKAFGPSANDSIIDPSLRGSPSMTTGPASDDMIDPALRSLGTPSMATSPVLVPTPTNLKLEPRKPEYSRFSSPPPRMPQPQVLPLTQTSFESPPPKFVRTYSQWSQSPEQNHVASSGTPSPVGSSTWPRYGDSHGQQAPNEQPSPLSRPRFAMRSPEQAIQSPQQVVRRSHSGIQSPQPPIPRPQFSPQRPYYPSQLPHQPPAHPENVQLHTKKVRQGPYGYMLAATSRDHDENPCAAGGSKKEESVAKKEYKSPYEM